MCNECLMSDHITVSFMRQFAELLKIKRKKKQKQISMENS